MFINQEIDPADIPVEYIRLSFAFLESAEKLNSEIAGDKWEGNFHRGQAVLWLFFHATELFLESKGTLPFNSKGRREKGARS